MRVTETDVLARSARVALTGIGAEGVHVVPRYEISSSAGSYQQRSPAGKWDMVRAEPGLREVGSSEDRISTAELSSK